MSEKRRRRLKRHESLQPLSRHHMEALHLALKLRRAGTEKSDLTLEELQQELKNFWEPNGQEHFREEEEILLPTYAQYKDINQPEIIEMLLDRKSTRLNSSHVASSYAVFCLQKKITHPQIRTRELDETYDED